MLKRIGAWLDGLEWQTLLCRIIGHGRPFQEAGTSVFICRRCRLVFGRSAPNVR